MCLPFLWQTRFSFLSLLQNISTKSFACHHSLTQTQHMRGPAHQGEHLNISQHMHLSVVDPMIGFHTAGGIGAVCTPVHYHVQHAPPPLRLPFRHHRRFCIRWCWLPPVLLISPGHPHAQHHGGPTLLPGGSDARLDWHGQCQSHHLW